MTTSQILVRVVPDPTRAEEISGPPLTERFAARVKELGASLGEISNDLRRELDRTLVPTTDSSWQLDVVELTFSLDIEAGAGVVVAKAKTSAGFEAALTWRRREP